MPQMWTVLDSETSESVVVSAVTAKEMVANGAGRYSITNAPLATARPPASLEQRVAKLEAAS